MPDTSLLDAPVATAPAPTAPPIAPPVNTAPPSLIADPAVPPPISDTTKPAPAPAATDAKTADPSKAETPVVPEVYADPKLPEGYVIQPEVKAEFDTLAKELKLPQESYQKLIDLQLKHQENEVKSAEKWLVDRNQQWSEETKKDFSTPESLRFVAKAIDRAFSDPKDAELFRNEMAISGYGNWKLMVHMMDFFGKQIGEDKFVDGKPAPSAPEKSLAQRLYPSLPSSPNSF